MFRSCRQAYNCSKKPTCTKQLLRQPVYSTTTNTTNNHHTPGPVWRNFPTLLCSNADAVCNLMFIQ